MGLVLEQHSKHLTGQLATILIPLVHYISSTCTKKISWILGLSYYQQSITLIKRSLKISKKVSVLSRIILYPQLRHTEPASGGKYTATLNSGERFNKCQREMKLKSKTTLGPSKNLDAQNQMRMITNNIAVIYIHCSLFNLIFNYVLT